MNSTMKPLRRLWEITIQHFTIKFSTCEQLALAEAGLMRYDASFEEIYENLRAKNCERLSYYSTN